MNKKFNPSLRSIFQYKTLPFMGKNPEGKEWGDKGRKRSPEEIRRENAPLISTNKSRIRGQDVAKWPHPGGDLACVGFGFLLSGWIYCLALILIWSSVILKLTDLDSYKTKLTSFQPPLFAIICPDLLISN